MKHHTRFVVALALGCACGEAESPPSQPEGVWTYEMLTDDEQALVDRGRDTEGWHQIQRAYANATPPLAGRDDGEVAP